MKKRFFITATGTALGKSFITAALVQQARAKKLSVNAIKPVISGFSMEEIQQTDTGLLLTSLGLPLTLQNIEALSPWRFKEPFAPSMAARQEGRTINFGELLAHSKETLKTSHDVVLIEGVGGLMVPLNDHYTVLDWMAALPSQALLVTGNYLGSISHALTALEVIKQRDLSVAGIIINESEHSPVSLGDTSEELKRWTSHPILLVKRQSAENDEANREALRSLLI